MLVDYSSYIAYICPYCGKLTERRLGVFDIPASGASLRCSNKSCGAEIVTITPKKDKYILETLCTACGEKHRMNFKRKGFFGKKKSVIACPQTSVEILFLGEEEQIKDELQQQAELYREAEEAIRSDASLNLYFGIIGEVNRIAKEGTVQCTHCGAQEADIELTDAGVLIECRNCEAKRLIPVTTESYEELLNTSTIMLD